MNDIEIIELFFDPSKENIDWIKREPRILNEQKSIISTDTTTKQPESTKTKIKNENENSKKETVPPSDTIFRDINNITKYIANREKEMKKIKDKNKQKEFVGKLKALLDLIKENDKYYKNKQQVSNCISRINKMIDQFEIAERPLSSTIKSYTTEMEEIKTPLPKKEIIYKNAQQLFSKDLKNINEITCPYCNKKLGIDSKIFIEHLKQNHNKELYSTVYGAGEIIKCKNCKAIITGCHPLVVIKHITKNCYTQNNRMEEDVNVILDNFVFQNRDTTSNNENEYTKRGLEIQTRLQDIRIEIKQQGNIKLYRDNIKRELLSLQKEISDNTKQFNKRDNINLRLAQIEDYLSKLDALEEKEIVSESPILTTKVSPQESSNKQSNDSKKTRMKTIWKHSLS